MTRRTYGDANRAVVIEEAIQELVLAKQRISEAHRFAVVGFGEKSEVIADFDGYSGPEAFLQALYDKAKILGEQPFFIQALNSAFQVVFRSMQKLSEGKTFRIIVVSEGQFAPEKGDWTQLTDTASKIGLYVDAVKIGQNQDVTLKRVTRATGGDFVECKLSELKSWLPSFAAVKKQTNINQTEADKNLKIAMDVIAAPLKTIRDQIVKPADLLKLITTEDASVKCGICYSLNCMICKGPPYACGAYCPNCGRFFHVHCAAGWAEAQSQKEGMPPNVFKCPVCFSLLKVPGAVNRVKILQARLKEEFIPPTDKVDMKKVKAKELGANWASEICAKCANIFDSPDEEVLVCGNSECNAKYHVKCMDEVDQVHQGRCRVCDVNTRSEIRCTERYSANRINFLALFNILRCDQ